VVVTGGPARVSWWIVLAFRGSTYPQPPHKWTTSPDSGPRRSSTPSTCWSWKVLTAPGTAGVRKAPLASILRTSRFGIRLNEHLEHDCGLTVFQHACRLGCEGIVSKRLGSRYRSGRSPDWPKFKNPQAPAVRREAEEDWGR
jgi:hypothetical protein